MPSIHDLVLAIRKRPGVRAVVISGRDGLLIDTDAPDGVDSDSVAAAAPEVLAATDSFGRLAASGDSTSALIEYTEGSAIVATLEHGALITVLLDDAGLGPSLLAELSRNRANISALFANAE